MTIVKGEIESLKRIKTQLSQKGVKRFNSIGSIKSFLQKYELEKEYIYNKTRNDLKIELENLEILRPKLQMEFDNLKSKETSILSNAIDNIENKCNLIDSRKSNILIDIFSFFQLVFFNLRKKRLKNNFDKTILEKTSAASFKLKNTNNLIQDYKTNKEEVIYNRSKQKISELDNLKKIVDGLYNDIAGAIGENLVVNELKKLSDENILINDFSVGFNPPIYHRKENDRIFSIQIDHILTTKSGIFIIETKNWSKKSIENVDLRSPIVQIKRTNYALYVMLNSNTTNSDSFLKRHHWGDKQIPIRNLIVMINNKPKEEFKFVKVKQLNELNSYINYFEPIFDDSEVNRISEFLQIMST